MVETEEPQAPTGAAPMVMQAIVRKRPIAAEYNGGTVLLAPHALFQRHDALYVAASTVTRDGRRPKEEKIGCFKLDGLGSMRIAEGEFRISRAFSPNDDRFAGQVLIAVER